nr:hypothetical protein Itr_chr01CG01320 [Ipomoea trifida]
MELVRTTTFWSRRDESWMFQANTYDTSARASDDLSCAQWSRRLAGLVSGEACYHVEPPRHDVSWSEEPDLSHCFSILGSYDFVFSGCFVFVGSPLHMLDTSFLISH